ncbi:hypothetical protein [Nannocystis bainbridge]|uniref:Uncharacterized protein n=1 Tax=Nannocystis bainbridge TaxID=2995303 RepID=A0ABT5E256_9BACT|nr:hypothetical protein [Nannocystis bainbridge]MDC0719954.1 hypothetical protein [Nannocystis bainbridge]
MTFLDSAETIDAASPEAAAELFAEKHELGDSLATLHVNVAAEGEPGYMYEISVLPVPLYRARRLAGPLAALPELEPKDAPRLFRVTAPKHGIDVVQRAESPQEAAEAVADDYELDAVLGPVVVTVAPPGGAPSRFRIRAYPAVVYEAEAEGPDRSEDGEKHGA